MRLLFYPFDTSEPHHSATLPKFLWKAAVHTCVNEQRRTNKYACVWLLCESWHRAGRCLCRCVRLSCAAVAVAHFLCCSCVSLACVLSECMFVVRRWSSQRWVICTAALMMRLHTHNAHLCSRTSSQRIFSLHISSRLKASFHSLVQVDSFKTFD